MTREKVNRISVALLVAGLLAGLLVYLLAAPVEIDPLLGEPLANKKYRRELRVMGGRANVAAAEFQDWFGSLWQGPALGGTIAVVTVAGVLIFRFLALLPPSPEHGPGPKSPPR